MSSLKAQDIVNVYKQTFLRGLGSVLPTLLTVWIVVACADFVVTAIATPISNTIKTRLVETETGNTVAFQTWPGLAFLRKPSANAAPAELSESEQVRWDRAEQERIATAEAQRKKDLRTEIDKRFPKWVGIVLAIVAVFVVGFFVAGVLGSSAWGAAESWASRIPLIKNIYPGAKQLVGFFLSEDASTDWQAVVACEFPRRGLWSIGFLTCDNIPEIEAHTGERVRGVYLGTPAAGQIVLAKESEIVAIDMTVDEALKFLFSGGVIGRDDIRPRGTPPPLPWQRASATGKVDPETL